MPDLHVSPSGNDENTGSLGHPLLTIDGALRRGRGRDIMSSLNIKLADGTYRGGNYALFPSDSGVTIEATGDPGAAILSGSTVVGGWEVFDGDVYRAPYQGQACPMQTMFEDGVRARAARFPKLAPGASYPSSFAPYLSSLGVTNHTQIEYDVGELDPTEWIMRQTQAVVWSGGDLFAGGIAWFTDTVPLIAVNVGLNLLGLSQNSRYEIGSGARYFVQNIMEFLTEPGEFVWDGTHIYYIFRGDPEAAVVEVPTALDIFTLNGQTGSLVEDVSLDGLALTKTAFPTWFRHAHVNEGDGYTDRERGPLDFLDTSDPYDRVMTLFQNRHGLINLTNASGVQIERCHLSDSGLHGIHAGGANTAHNIADSWIEKTGHSGIYTDGLYPGGGDVSRDWTVTDVKVTDVGQLAGSGGGMIFINSGHHTVSHCAFERGPRNGFFVGAYIDIPEDDCYAEGILLEQSSFLDFCQDSGDVGVIGLGGLSSIEGGPIQSNTVSQVTVEGANAHPSMLDVAPNGIYTDNQSWGQVFQNVEVSDTQGNQFRINDSGGHTYTNTSFQSDGSANPSFNPALMSPTIGLTGEFPF